MLSDLVSMATTSVGGAGGAKQTNYNESISAA